MSHILTNPIFLGFASGLIVAGILYWNYTRELENNKKNNNDKKIKINYVLPILVGVAVWFLISSYQDFYPSVSGSSKPVDMSIKDKIVTDTSSSIKGGKSPKIDISEGFKTLTNNIRMPTNDIFLDIAAF